MFIQASSNPKTRDYADTDKTKLHVQATWRPPVFVISVSTVHYSCTKYDLRPVPFRLRLRLRLRFLFRFEVLRCSSPQSYSYGRCGRTAVLDSTVRSYHLRAPIALQPYVARRGIPYV